jgi:hypothetical protein
MLSRLTPGFMFQGEHVEIGGVPVQFVIADPVWLREAIEAGVEIPYDETLQPPVMMRLVTPTYLAARWLAVSEHAGSARTDGQVARSRSH